MVDFNLGLNLGARPTPEPAPQEETLITADSTIYTADDITISADRG